MALNLRSALLTSAAIALSSIMSSNANAQDPISAYLQTDRAFLAPGTSYSLIIEIANPANSDFFISRSLGGGYRPSYGLNNPADFSIAYSPICNAGITCDTTNGNPISLAPGRTDTYHHLVINVDADAAIGSEIRISDIHLSLSNDETGRRLNDIHLVSDFVGIVASPGQGDQAVLDAKSTLNPNRGTSDVDAELTLYYPSSIDAGENFEITGTLTNIGSRAIDSSFVLSSSLHLGTHSGSFRQISCLFKCKFNGRFPLKHGESIDLLFRQAFYENEFLFSGDITIQAPHAIVRDSRGREAYIYADDVHVAIQQFGGKENSLAESFDLPERQPLIRQNSIQNSNREIIFDPNTGRNWIPLSKSQGISLQETIEETKADGRFAGFSVANSNEVTTLMLNHIYASKLMYPSYALFQGGRELYTVSGTFLDLIGTTLIPEHENGTTRYARGFVADAPEAGNQTVSMSTYQQNCDSGFLCKTGMYNLDSFYLNQYAGMGTWLISDEEVLANQASSSDGITADIVEAEFEKGQLFIASVEVENQTYQVTLAVIDNEQTTLELISVANEYNRTPSASYDVTSLILSIPRLGFLDFPNNYLYFAVELELIPGSNPPQFRLLSSRDVD